MFGEIHSVAGAKIYLQFAHAFTERRDFSRIALRQAFYANLHFRSGGAVAKFIKPAGERVGPDDLFHV